MVLTWSRVFSSFELLCEALLSPFHLHSQRREWMSTVGISTAPRPHWLLQSEKAAILDAVNAVVDHNNIYARVKKAAAKESVDGIHNPLQVIFTPILGIALRTMLLQVQSLPVHSDLHAAVSTLIIHAQADAAAVGSGDDTKPLVQLLKKK
ncbi:Hypothetical protein, putative [Bodo saltans]|uniref:GPI-anchored surface protein n=1 Tax=Bodo saltans TaxID=75058 RepID=A0A0S4ILT8_BODSA|nr:Hypothetical protein, putative [Bodo saltans]|eukprot:CUE70691.1 Hypothetical protein, putative [Bodo saltans]